MNFHIIQIKFKLLILAWKGFLISPASFLPLSLLHYVSKQYFSSFSSSIMPHLHSFGKLLPPLLLNSYSSLSLSWNDIPQDAPLNVFANHWLLPLLSQKTAYWMQLLVQCKSIQSPFSQRLAKYLAHSRYIFMKRLMNIHIKLQTQFPVGARWVTSLLA